ncbi:MAG: alanine:cation symporter family protein, partial [Oscillospiraceae bacterium]
LLGWSYYGERGLSHILHTDRFTPLYRAVFMAVIVVGSVGDLAAVWQLADVLNGLMALPNLVALLLLSPEVLRQLDAFLDQKKELAV